MSAKNGGKKVTDTDRKARLAEELRANLKRRKAKGRASGVSDKKAGSRQAETDR